MAGLKPAFFYLREKIGTDKSLNVCKRLLLENSRSCHELRSASQSKKRCTLGKAEKDRNRDVRCAHEKERAKKGTDRVLWSLFREGQGS